jgi:hypothetical protein
LLGDGDKEIEIVYGVFCTGPTRAARLNKNLVYRQDKPNESTKEVPLLFVLFESPFTLVSSVSRCHTSLVSLVLGAVNTMCLGIIRYK